MKAHLIWNNGKRYEVDGGAARIHYPHRGPKGRYLETIFECEGSDLSGEKLGLVYREKETIDVTAQMHEAEETNRRRTWDYLLQGWESHD